MIGRLFNRKAEVAEPTARLYEEDWVQWVEHTTQLLSQRQFSAIDLEQLILELDVLGKQERRSIRALLKVILTMLLKWQCFPDSRTPQEDALMLDHVHKIDDILQDSPSLRSYLESALQDTYVKARAIVALEYDIAIDTFPKECPISLDQVLGI